jgi:hypothetical protein
MDRYAIFVDAGYFFAAGAQSIVGSHTTRKHISLQDPSAMFADLFDTASSIVDGLPLLRAYWYDAMAGSRPSLEQSTVANLPGVKLRLGALNSAGEQKGVDSLIVTDVIDLARNRAIADAILVTGDEDLRIAVQVAQSFGVRVHILAAGDHTKNVSPTLQMESDSFHALNKAWFSKHFVIQQTDVAQISTPPDASTATHGGALPALELDEAANQVIAELLKDIATEQLTALAGIVTNQKSVPPEFDGKLIAKTSALVKRKFSGEENRKIRGLFISSVKARTTG